MDQYKQQLTAIIADDEPSILRGIHDTIDWTSLGISIVGLAYNGAQALNLILEHKPDITIIDIKMPSLSGLDAIRKAREVRCDTDFIILSGYNDFAYAQEAIRMGARAYLLKPVVTHELYGELYRIVNERVSRRKSLSHAKLTIPLSQRPDPVFFNKLVDSHVLTTGDITKAISASEIELDNSSCFVLVFLFDSASLEYDALLSLLENAFVSTKHNFWKHENGKIVGIFNTSGHSTLHIAQLCMTTICDGKFPTPKIGVGDIVSALSQCSYSYSRALTALSYRIYDDKCNIYTPQIICDAFPKLKFEDVEYQPLIQDIERNNIAGIHRYCNEFINKLLYVPMPPPNYVLSLCSALLNAIIHTFTLFYGEDLSSLIQAKDLSAQKSLSEIRQWMSRAFCHISNAITAFNDQKDAKRNEDVQIKVTDDPLIVTVQQYIQEHITDNIKLEDIAKQVHLSPTYFATYFKNKVGINFRNYLILLKMEYAKKELIRPLASVSEVANALGYSDYRSFSRAFKSVFGITPSDYQVNPNMERPCHEKANQDS